MEAEAKDYSVRVSLGWTEDSAASDRGRERISNLRGGTVDLRGIERTWCGQPFAMAQILELKRASEIYVRIPDHLLL